MKLSNAEKALLQRNGINQDIYRYRIRRGWTEQQAKFLDNTFRMHDGEIFKVFKTKFDKFYMTPTQFFLMRAKNLNYNVVQRRLEHGHTMQESVKTPYGQLNVDVFYSDELKEVEDKTKKRKASIEYAQLLFGQMMKNFISKEEYKKCVKSN